ncbi:signal peptidase I [Bifidobacterium stellenboschense]|uniref:Signal peptidase I n=1 Tax=Bifidobacterium stellenboschense TaxID=762211 RepID=A0A087DCQ8_9BIFI|nr:signal peptidase I [Bifidobacterium stellenboschense]KFI93308.1 signal peptidase [Bifidobacterium stellenboschense]
MPYENDERDRHTVQVADHGVDPTAMPPASTAATTASRRRQARGARRDDGFSWRDTLIWCGIPILVVILIRVFLVGFYEIPTRSMESTIEPGDRVVTLKLAPKTFGLERGDIVVFHDPAGWLANEQSTSPLAGDYLIKRVIGLPGDTVSCAGAGKPITVNGVAITETAYLKNGVQPSAFPFSVTVTAGHVFVMGDNRANSADSRYHQDDGDHGLVPIGNVVGVGLCRYWPLSRLGSLDAHHEVFADVPDASASAATGTSDDSGTSGTSDTSGTSGGTSDANVTTIDPKHANDGVGN